MMITVDIRRGFTNACAHTLAKELKTSLIAPSNEITADNNMWTHAFYLGGNLACANLTESNIRWLLNLCGIYFKL